MTRKRQDRENGGREGTFCRMSGMPSGGERDLGSISREGRRKKRNEDVAAVREVCLSQKNVRPAARSMFFEVREKQMLKVLTENSYSPFFVLSGFLLRICEWTALRWMLFLPQLIKKFLKVF